MKAILRTQNNFTTSYNFLFVSKNKQGQTGKTQSNKYYMFESILMEDSYKNYVNNGKLLYTSTYIYR